MTPRNAEPRSDRSPIGPFLVPALKSGSLSALFVLHRETFCLYPPSCRAAKNGWLFFAASLVALLSAACTVGSNRHYAIMKNCAFYYRRRRRRRRRVHAPRLASGSRTLSRAACTYDWEFLAIWNA